MRLPNLSEVLEDLAVREENKQKILDLIESFSKIPKLENVEIFFYYMNAFNKLFNDLLIIEGNIKFKTSVIFQFVLLIYINKYEINSFFKNKINLNFKPSDYFELTLVNIFFKNYNYKISKYTYLFSL